MTATIDTERLARITTLYSGSHEPPNGDFAACVMEAVSSTESLQASALDLVERMCALKEETP